MGGGHCLGVVHDDESEEEEEEDTEEQDMIGSVLMRYTLSRDWPYRDASQEAGGEDPGDRPSVQGSWRYLANLRKPV